MSNELDLKVYQDIKGVLETARLKAYAAVNFSMVESYWHIGKIIVDTQGGNQKAEYGDYLLKKLSTELTKEFGKGFGVRNLNNMRSFYISFRNWNAVRSELSWTHYRLLLKVERPEVREFYLKECINSNWSTRQLERQINSFFYERLLSSKEKELVKQENKNWKKILSNYQKTKREFQ